MTSVWRVLDAAIGLEKSSKRVSGYTPNFSPNRLMSLKRKTIYRFGEYELDINRRVFTCGGCGPIVGAKH